MTINPKVGMYLSIFLALLGVLVGGATQLTTLLGEHTTNIILALSVLLLSAGNAVNAILHAIPSVSGPVGAAEFPLGPKGK